MRLLLYVNRIPKRKIDTLAPSVFHDLSPFHFFHYLCPLLLFFFSLWVIAVLIRCQVRVLMDAARGRLGKTGQSSLVRVPRCSARHPAMSSRAHFVTQYWFFYYFHFNSWGIIAFLSAEAFFITFGTKGCCSSPRLFSLLMNLLIIFFWIIWGTENSEK